MNKYILLISFFASSLAFGGSDSKPGSPGSCESTYSGTVSTESLTTRLKKSGVQFRSNDNVSEHLSPADRTEMVDKLTGKFREILDILGIDQENDHNTNDSPRRIAEAWAEELFSGRYEDPPKITVFPNAGGLKEPVFVGPLKVKSFCAHHFLPFIGDAYISIVPGESVMGLSKYARIVEWFSKRPQIQEELTAQILKFLIEKMKPAGLIVHIKAKHFCMVCRGVEQESWTSTTASMGDLVGAEQRTLFFQQVQNHRD